MNKNNLLTTITLIFIACFGYIFVNQYVQNKTDKMAIEITNQCLSFYENNHKLPQLIAGKENKFLYDNQHILLVYNGDFNSKTIIVANYRDDEMASIKEIWDFVDLFPEESVKTSKIKYIYGNTIVNINR